MQKKILQVNISLKITVAIFLVFWTSLVAAAKFTDSGQELIGLSQASFSWGDYDQDGDLDLAVCGRKADGPQTIIYRNDNGILAEDTKQQIIGISYGKIGWTDYDSDGDLDLSLAGYDPSVQPTSKIYTNVQGILVEDPTQHPEIRYGSIDWADSDNDKKPDTYAHAGHDSNWQPYTKVFKKNEKGDMEETKQDLISIYYGAVAWGDYTGDGKLDLLITGWTPNGGLIRVYKNVDGTLVEDKEQKVDAVFHSSALWGDYDLDGDIDLIVSGQNNDKVITKVYRNDNGILVEDTSQELPGVNFCCLSLCDYDKDGDLDLLLAGALADKTPITKLFLNDAALPVPIDHIEIWLEGKAFKGGTFTTDNTLNLSAKAYDAQNNPIRDIEATWQLDNFVGTIAQQKDKGISIDLTKVGTATLIAYDRQGHTATAMLKIDVGKLFVLQIEGETPKIPIGTLTVTPDMKLIFYSRGYDADNNLRGEEVANWSLTGDIGMLSTTTGTSTTFTPGKTGEGIIMLDDGQGHSDRTGTITVTPGITVALKIEDVHGDEIREMLVTADEDAYCLYARGYDVATNPTGPVEVQWSLMGEIGNLSLANGTMTTFNPISTGTGTVKIVDTANHIAYSGLITVMAGKPTELEIVDKDDKPVNNIILTADDKLELFAKTFDKEGNEISLIEVNWKLIGNIGNLSTNTATSVLLDLTTVGTGSIIAEGFLSDATGIITVLHGKEHHFVFEPVDDQVVEVPFGITVTAKDADGNTVTNYNGTSNTFVDTTGTLDYGQVSFEEGVLNNHPVTISKACGSVTLVTRNIDEKEGESNRFAVKGGDIYGEVKDESGSRLANILIEAYLRFENGTPTFKGSTTTLPDGSYLIAGLPSGTYAVKVIPPAGYGAKDSPQITQIKVVEIEYKGAKKTMALKVDSAVNFVLVIKRLSLDQVIVYPNPVHPPAQQHFKGLDGRNVVIKIFNIAGELVKKIPFGVVGVNQEVDWDVTNEDNRRVASGIYIYLIQDTTTGETKTGKIGVIK
ncbi:MAG: FG-GAP-like repeat-containing protein [bacterium]|nr:FG-GAP-like repeat-containing protein [bacterium]